MDLYTFRVDRIEINNTRADINDTLHLALSAYVNGDLVAQKILHLGDFNNGSTIVPPDRLWNVVINDPTSAVGFIFQLVNARNVPGSELAGRFQATADQAAGMLANLAGAGAAGAADAASSPLFIAALAIEAGLYAWLDNGCDGPVAVDQVSGPRYVIDAWADGVHRPWIIFDRQYPGSDSPTFCGANSDYKVTWSLRHDRAWIEIGHLTTGLLTTATAAPHRGGLYVVGLDLWHPEGITGYRTFTGANWERVITFNEFVLNTSLPVNAISFNDRLYIFWIHSDGLITTRAYTVDGSSWTDFYSGPTGLQTALPITTVEFRNRLYLLARDSTSGRLRLTWTDDLEYWEPWADIAEPPGPPPTTAMAAASLDGKLHIFGIYTPVSDEVRLWHNWTADGMIWNGWQRVERGAHLSGAADAPLDVAAGTFQSRIYLASRWEFSDALPALALNFSGDGENWSGWRIPQSDKDFRAWGTAALATIGNHLYVFAPQAVTGTVYVY